MGDPSHLEKMGRELKCPICLSLLNSAVSLPCNHVFCNACIMKSMKSGYNCPVCKVPYRRREIRAAPHMDNLVSVYKSMEVASGVNIFITQTAPANKPSNDKKRVEGDPISGKIIDQSCQVMENQQMSKKKGFSRTDKSIEEFSGPIIVKPTFPTKKRVQVPQSRPAELHCELVGDAKEESKNTSSLSMNPAPNGNKELVLSPFFWLRDEEDEEGEEKSSQLADGDRLLDTTPPNIPSFSDMKDSDDESPSKAEVNEKSNSMDLFDCEMFEWTQRACSPELLPSPVKVQALHTSETVQESELKESSQGATEEVAGTRSMECMNVTHKTGTLNEDPSVSTPGDKTINQIRGGKSNKRGRKAKQIAGQKRANSNGDKVCKVHVDLKKDSENFISMQATDEIGNSLNLKKARKMDKWVGFGTDVAEPNASTSLGAESLDDGEQNVVNELPTVLCEEQGVDKDPDLKTSEENIKMKTHSQKDCSLRVKRRKLDSAKTVILEEVSKVQSRRNKSRVHEESFSSVSLGDDKNISDLKETPSKQTRKVKSTLTSKCNRALGLKKKMMVSFNDVSKDGFIDIYQEGYTNVSVKEIQSVELVQGDAAVKVLDGSIVEKLPLTSGVALRKCDTVTNRVQCAFCLSSAESQVAGEMLHYFNGRPVSADYDGGSKIIHSHRNCTEWAPNIYFENDAAINLEAELIRSRRIKCCCCGLKGAALGCYEKSCRKSFHVTCAKLTPECRWDTDNFVMLCPIHASSKLPNEDTGSRQMSKKRTSKGNMGTECNQVAVKHDTSSHENRKFCGSSGKLVLCCSALTVEEREIVSEFGKLSRVTVSKKWVSSVTHVIASTDENGACRRTLKVLMGILEGKWIVNIEWVKACISTMKQVDEEQYEITLDVHGIRDGPHLGRERLLNKRLKLFEGCKFYIMGDFVPSYKGYLQDLVIAAGGKVLHRRSLSGDQGVMLSSSSAASTCIIYSLEMPDKCDPRKKDLILSRRRSDAEALASSTGAKAVSNSWILNSIAACKLQSLSEK